MISRDSRHLLFAALAGIVLVCSQSGYAGNAGPNICDQIQVLKVRIEPYRTPDGIKIQQVILVFKNKGPKVVREMWGDVHVYDAHGNETNDSYPHRCLFAAEDSVPVQSGEKREKQVVYFFGSRLGQSAARAKVIVTEAYEQPTSMK